MTESLTTALERSAQPREVKTIRDLVERMKPELVKSLHDEAAVERLMRHYNTAILVDPAYTAKALAALIADARHGQLESQRPTVFIHTGGVPLVFAVADEVLPPGLTQQPS